jgi:hypothetical protein
MENNMSISGITSNDNSYLASLLNAQQVATQMQQNSPFAQLLQNNQNGGQTQGQQSNCQINSVASQDFQNMATSLQTGDLDGAQQAYTQLTQDMQSTGQTRGHHHHHHHQSSGTPQTNATNNNQVVGAAGAAGSASPANGQTSVTV